jgi:hypothetical protein
MRYVKAAAATTVLFAVAVVAGDGTIRTVQVRKAPITDKPQYLATVIDSLKYLDQVAVMEEKKPFLHIKPQGGGKEGWINETAVTTKNAEIKAAANDPNKKAAPEDAANAGRGFSAEIEAEFRKGHPDLQKGYDALDKLLNDPALALTYDQTHAFAVEGKLGGGK